MCTAFPWLDLQSRSIEENDKLKGLPTSAETYREHPHCRQVEKLEQRFK